MTGGDHARAASCFVAGLGGVLMCWSDPTERGQDTSRKVRAVGLGRNASVSNEPKNLVRAWRNLPFSPARWFCALFDKVRLA